MKILVTGAAGFIGFHLAERLLKDGHEVLGLDCINDYYDVRLKHGRLRESGIDPDHLSYGAVRKSSKHPSYGFIFLKLEDRDAMADLFKSWNPEIVCHLAAQAGVRYSLSNPFAYVDSNMNGFVTILEGCRATGVRHLVFASSSSVYGLNTSMPFSTSDSVDHPISLYAASKKANELMAHTYSHLFRIPCTGLRFFTVYGPWGRPDMAYYKFTKAILEGSPIDVYNNGNMKRDFTYIDDIVEGIVRVAAKPPAENPAWDSTHPDPATSPAPYHVYNIGNSSPVELIDFIRAIENACGKKAVMNMLPIQPGDVPATYADVTDLTRDTGYRPGTPVSYGVDCFVKWYREYYRV